MRGYYPGYGQKSGGGIVFALFILGVFLTVCLYFVKTRAQAAKAEVIRLERLVHAEQSAVKVLRAELSHLESPGRLSVIANAELGLEPIKVEQVIAVSEIAELFPLRDTETEVRP